MTIGVAGFDKAGSALVEAVADGNAPLLAELLKKHGGHSVLSQPLNEFDGTLHYHALNTMMLMSQQEITEPLSQKFLDVARVLRDHGYPVQHQKTPNGVGMIFLDSDWSGSGNQALLSEAMAEYIQAGVLDPNGLLPKDSFWGALPPITTTFWRGNPAALQVLLDNGADLDAALASSQSKDVFELAGSFGNSQPTQIIAVLSAYVMRETISNAVGNSVPVEPARPARRGPSV